MSEIHDKNWTDFYKNKKSGTLYPCEFLIRILQGGNYPDLKMDKSLYKQAKILDMSCGDGRNLEFLLSLGFDVHATEINEPIIESIKENNPCLDKVTFATGKAHSMPFENSFFEYLVASHCMFYLDQGVSIVDNIAEIARIIKQNGVFIGTYTLLSSDIFNNAQKVADYTYLIKDDPHKKRNGYVMSGVVNEKELIELLEPYFSDFSIGFQKNDFWGYTLDYFVFKCVRK